MLGQLFDYSQRAGRAGAGGSAGAGGVDSPRAPRGDGASDDRAGAVRFGARSYRHSAAAGRGDRTTCPARPTCRRSKASIRKKEGRQNRPQAGCRTSRSAAWCSRFVADKHGDLYYVRIYSGRLKANSRVLQSRQGQEGKRRPAVAHPGRPPRTGPSGRGGRHRRRDRPAASRSPATRSATPPSRSCWNRSSFPETVISMAIEPETSPERKKLGEVLEMMKRQDPTFRAEENEETGQTIISGMGELHLEVIKHRLLRRFQSDMCASTSRASAIAKRCEHAAEAIGQMPSAAGRPNDVRQGAGSGSSHFRQATCRAVVTMALATRLPPRVIWQAVLDVLTRARRKGAARSAAR